LHAAVVESHALQDVRRVVDLAFGGVEDGRHGGLGHPSVGNRLKNKLGGALGGGGPHGCKLALLALGTGGKVLAEDVIQVQALALAQVR
jgi:hypothetical protein